MLITTSFKTKHILGNYAQNGNKITYFIQINKLHYEVLYLLSHHCHNVISLITTKVTSTQFNIDVTSVDSNYENKSLASKTHC